MRVEVAHIGSPYAKRVIAHLEGKSPGNVTAFQLPAALPLMVDDSEEFLPPALGAAEVIIAIHLHQDLLSEIPHFVKGKATRALIAPIEDPTWIRPGLQRQVTAACAGANIESAFPRPFCHLEPASPVIEEFSRIYEVGRPEFKFTVNGGKIVKAEMVRGALCGACEKVAEGLVGMSLEEDVVQAAGVLHHTYPCMASMAMVEELGDTLMHESIRMVKGGVQKALEEAEEE